MPDWFEILADRTVLSISGDEAATFLENLVTCKVEGMEDGDARFGALLTPQGKIMFDFFLIRQTDGYLIDTPADHSEDLVKRLLFYKLRARVEIGKKPDIMVAAFDGQATDGSEVIVSDPRHADMGKRAYGAFRGSNGRSKYDALRVQHGVPEAGSDFGYGDAYPHEVLMDQFGGVDFKKGCYVGQEVVSRMQHKTVVRKRLVKLHSTVELPQTGSTILADGKPAGTLGTIVGSNGLAVVRLDRMHKAETVEVEGIPISCTLPDWVSYSWPESE